MSSCRRHTLRYTTVLEHKKQNNMIVLTWKSIVKPPYLLLSALKAAAIPLEVIKGFPHQTIQIHLVTELQLWVSLKHYGDHHQQLCTQQGEVNRWERWWWFACNNLVTRFWTKMFDCHRKMMQRSSRNPDMVWLIQVCVILILSCLCTLVLLVIGCVPPLWFVCTQAGGCSSACPPPEERSSFRTSSCQTASVATENEIEVCKILVLLGKHNLFTIFTYSRCVYETEKHLFLK